MIKITFLLLTVFSCYFFLACHTDNSKVSAEAKTEGASLDKQWARSFIDSVNNKFSEQIASGDSVGLASHYWPDAELLLDNSEVVKGKAIQSSWREFIQMGAKKMSFSTTDISGNGNYIIETGHYEIRNGEDKLLDQGKYVVIWEKRGEEWKLFRDIGCTSMPVAAH